MFKKEINDQTILIADVVNSNNRKYTKESIAKMVAELEGKEVFGTIGYGTGIGVVDISKSAFISKNFRIEDENPVCDNILIDTPCGDIAKTLMEDIERGDMVFRPAMLAKVETVDGVTVIEEADLYSVALINKKDDAFKDNE